MTAEHMASCQNKKPCAPEQQKQDSPHRDHDTFGLTPSGKSNLTWFEAKIMHKLIGFQLPMQLKIHIIYT